MTRRKIILIGIPILLAISGFFVASCILPADAAWIDALGYREDELYSLTFHGTGKRSCPEIPIEIGGETYPFLFDTGCGSGLTVTTELAEAIDYETLERTEELNRDGSHRGWSERI